MQQLQHFQMQQMLQMQTAHFGAQGSFADSVQMQQIQMMQQAQQPCYLDQAAAMQQFQAQDMQRSQYAHQMQQMEQMYRMQQISMPDYSGTVASGHVKNHALEAVTEALNRAKIDDLLVQTT